MRKNMRRALAWILTVGLLAGGLATGSVAYADIADNENTDKEESISGDDAEYSDAARDISEGEDHEAEPADAETEPVKTVAEPAEAEVESYEEDEGSSEESSEFCYETYYEENSADAEDVAEDTDDDRQILIEDDEDTAEENDHPAEAGYYSFPKDWNKWAQSGFFDSYIKKNACRMVAYSKMLIQTGAVPLEAAENGSFNPGVFYDWCASHGWISGAIAEVSPPGTCPVKFAADRYGSVLTMDLLPVDGWSNAQKREKIVDLVNDGYVVVLCSGAHFVCVDVDATKENSYPYLQESYSASEGRTVRVEDGNHPLSTYTKLRYFKCTEGPTKDPGPLDLTLEGKCGDSLTWEMKKVSGKTDTYDLTISGTGDMWNWEEPVFDGKHISQMPPWMQNKQRASKKDVDIYFRKLIIGSGVTSIGNNAFSYMKSFGGTDSGPLTIPSTVTRIGDKAFASNNFRGSLTIPDSVKEIGDSAFESCSDFTGTLTIPASATKIGERAFASCSQLTGLSFEAGSRLEEIPDSCFYWDYNLSGNISFPESLKRIGDSAFKLSSGDRSREKSKHIILSSGLEEIGEFAFMDNANMTIDAPILPQNLKSLGMQAFMNCESLTGELDIPGSLKEIPYYGFRGCSGLTKLTINEGVERVGVAAFYGCENIEGELDLPEGLHEISEAAFKNCKHISKLTIPNRAPDMDRPLSFEHAAFEGCSSLTGDLVLNDYDVSVYNNSSCRVFMGTRITKVILEGEWSDSDVKLFEKNKAIGSYSSYADIDENGNSLMNNVEVSTFPEGVTICYDDRLYMSERKNDAPGYREENLVKALKDLGYGGVKTFTEAGIASPTYHIREIAVYDIRAYLNEKNSLYTIYPYRPFYADDTAGVSVKIADTSVAEARKKPGDSFWTVIPKKVGETTYTVNFTSEKYGNMGPKTGKIIVAASKKGVTGISIYEAPEKTIGLGETYTLRADVQTIGKAGKAVTWKSSDPTVVSVSSKGVITAVSEGEAIITAASKADPGYSAECKVIVEIKRYDLTFMHPDAALTSKGWWDEHSELVTKDDEDETTVRFEQNVQEVRSLPVAKKEGHTFGGWYTDPTFVNRLSMIPKDHKGDLTLYPKLTPWKYTVKYAPNGTKTSKVTGKMKPAVSYYGDTLTLSTAGYVRKGYRLAGWSLSETATEPDEGLSGSEIELSWDEIPAGLKPAKNNDTRTLYAVWKESPYYIEYALNGGSIPAGDEDKYPETYTYGTALSLPAPVREDYSFAGWYSDQALKKKVKSVTAKTSGDLRLFAKWSAAYKVVLHDDTGREKTYGGFVFGKNKSLPANPFKKQSNAFMGWSTVSGGNAVYANKQKISTPQLGKTEDGALKLDLYTVWQDQMTIDEFDLRDGYYDATGEKNTGMSAGMTYTYDQICKKNVVLPKKMKRDGYAFKGWYDKYTGKKVTQITSKNFRDYALYAAWKPLSYRITFKANPPKKKKASGRMKVQILTVDDGGKLSVNRFSVKGYRFLGWSTSKYSGSQEYKDHTVYFPSNYRKSVTLYGVWEEIE